MLPLFSATLQYSKHYLYFKSMKRQLLLLTFFIFFWGNVNAQIITAIATNWSDDFRDWTIYTDEEDVEGSLTMRWQQQMDWTEWDYRLGEESGTIKLKWKNDPSQWEIRGGGKIISARMVWNNDIHEWRISDGTTRLTLKALYNNNLNDWEIKESKENGTFELYMEWQNDPREWTIVDELNEDINIHFKIAIAFVALFQTIPK